MIRLMTDAEHIQAALERATQARQEQTKLQQRLRTATEQAQAVEKEVADRRTVLADETEDVERLESFSLTRIWATLKGSRDADLDREVAERDAERYAVAEAEARLEVARRDVASLEAQLRQLGDVEADYDAALKAKEQWLLSTGAPNATELARVAEERGALLAEDTEAREAHAAGLAARDLLLHAQQLLGNAQSWSTWDTFGGGGLFSDMMKYDKLDQVTAVLRQADQALDRFSRELADVGMRAVRGVEIDGLTRTFDVFFDNFFSDLAVRRRIQDAAARVDEAVAAVEQVLQRLTARGKEIAEQLGDLDARRSALLT